MGFDIYGMNPVLKKGSVKPERPDSSVDIYEDTDGAWSKYFELLAEYEDENPGIYFRANVWSWRPIVEFLCEHMDFLDQDEANDLSYNNGGIINSEKANRIAERIFDLDDIDAINQWVHTSRSLQYLCLIKKAVVFVKVLVLEMCNLCLLILNHLPKKVSLDTNVMVVMVKEFKNLLLLTTHLVEIGL